jgi:L-ascorbate metabolism protein UlaG (beta-lactamase superfamily)
VRWFGHAAFEIVSPGGTRLLIDPWLLENPSTPAIYKDTTRWARPDARPSAILATHPHADHDGDVPLLATEAEVRAAFRGDRRLQLLVPGEEKSF